MGWFSEVTTPFTPKCPKCGGDMDTMQTKGYDDDKKYFLEHGEPYSAPLEMAMNESSEITSGGATALRTINSCHACNIFAEWTFYKKEELEDE